MARIKTTSQPAGAHDDLYGRALREVPAFVFDGEVARVFDDMISRSVPLYEDAQQLAAQISARFASTGGTVYDLGCSTGTTLIRVHQELSRLTAGTRQIVGVDNSEAMLAACREKLAANHCADDILLVHSDIERFVPGAASVLLLNYTLQFIGKAKRIHILERLQRSLVPEGCLLLSEKVRHQDKVLDDIIFEMHHEFKRAHGYSNLEIAQKREALEDVLVPLSVEENRELLHRAGFSKTETLLKGYNFASILALK